MSSRGNRSLAIKALMPFAVIPGPPLTGARSRSFRSPEKFGDLASASRPESVASSFSRVSAVSQPVCGDLASVFRPSSSICVSHHARAGTNPRTGESATSPTRFVLPASTSLLAPVSGSHSVRTR